jgi:hypothetical protein
MSKSHGGVSSLGGWLYADLMLILFIGILSQVALPPKKVVDVEPTLTSTPTPTVTPTIRPTVLARIGRDYKTVNLRTTPSMEGDIQGELLQDAFVYVLDAQGDWANVVITTFIRADLLRAPNDAVFSTPLAPTPSPTVYIPQGPTPTATALPSLSRENITFTVPMARSLSTAGSRDVQIQFRDQVSEKLKETLADKGIPSDVRIGMVLAFGGSAGGSLGQGIDTARRTQAILQQTLSDEVSDRFQSTRFENFFDTRIPIDNVQLWVYVYVN